MRLWCPPSGETLFSIGLRLTSESCLIIVASAGIFLSASLSAGSPPLPVAATANAPIPAQRAGHASSAQVGSAMAVLATLDQARVLPPEGTREADRVIKAVIQLQSAFAKSPDRAVQDFLHRAVTRTQAARAAEVLEQFRSNGWTPEVLEALAEEERLASAEHIESLTRGLREFNLSVEEFRRFMQLVRNGEQALASQGQKFHEVYAVHRKSMPGPTVR